MNEIPKESFNQQVTDDFVIAEQPVPVLHENLGEDLIGHKGKIPKSLAKLGLNAVAK